MSDGRGNRNENVFHVSDNCVDVRERFISTINEVGGITDLRDAETNITYILYECVNFPKIKIITLQSSQVTTT